MRFIGDIGGGNLKYLAESILMAEISRRIIRLSDYVATSISYYAKFIDDLAHRQAPLIPIASNIPTTLENCDISSLRKSIAPKGEFIVSFIGRRDITVVCKALSRLIADGQNIKALFIGKTNEPNDIADANICRTGVLSIEELSQYVAAADCMVMPEHKDSGCSFKSGSLAAALSFGIPVITSKGYLTEDKLLNRKNILFIDPQSVDDYYNIIKRLIEDNQLRKTVSQGAHELGKQLTWARTYEEYMRIIRQ